MRRHPYYFTPRSCRQRQALPLEQRARLDRLVLGLAMVPTIGVYDEPSDTWRAHLGSELVVLYRVTLRPEVMVIDVLPMGVEPVVQARVRAC